ncbi:hypothetical protein TRIATDRAFT_280152 [Trichoderma atroviride IMI 206040]|uniref:DUF6594 domain-containing protein n=1 Tax=Hypocrea atroviridis (strain ATCC 20476 / IMI 206040) TaxID=452589 RepID=G9NG41_HYPAI|nr:uncharacterized protein TRIATDRAFT_280152 [Trichoderma atroviride IMI 206040]EHK50253.1 hypothetical protein TRIATDRAFT_280152 [Trichoderma atroviride IMI 206040]
MNSNSRQVYVDGFPSLSDFIASDRDGTSAIFKRFNRLAARNLLVLQSELAELEAKLDRYDHEDQADRQDKADRLNALQSLRNWEDYKARNDKNSDRMKLLEQIRTTLKEYNRKILKAFRIYFFHGRPEESKDWPMLGGHSSSLYEDPDDLLVLHTTEPPDRLTVFVQDYLGFFFRDENTHGASAGPLVGYASGKKISIFISYLSAILAALLLVGAIIILYRTKSNDVKLGLLALFTTLFAASVGLLTNAKQAEVFGATAAYAAVLVVFVSGGLGS